jgi:radical SAM protein with 4Fe4S-binding SPASM domain
MLMLSDMLDVARGTSLERAASKSARERFAPSAGQAPVVVWNVCRHCDMSCPHCYISAGARPSPSDLSTTAAVEVLEQLAEVGVRTVIFSGGEPLLRADLFELLGRAQVLGISAQLSTNGVSIDDVAAERLARLGVAYVGVSVDGRPGWNDAYRGMPGAHDRALAGLDAARRAGMKTGLRITVTRRNLGELGPMLAIAEERQVRRFYVSHLVYSGRGARLVPEDLSREEARALLTGLFQAAEGLLDRKVDLRIVTGSNDSDGPFLLRWIARRHGDQARGRVEELLRLRGGNSAGERLLCIDSRGRVHPDQFWQEEVLGTLPGDHLRDVLRHPLREALRERESRLQGRCGTCRYRAVCRGSHRERAAAAGLGIWGSDPACVLTDQEISQEVPS